jgi:hypothetical protein
MARGSYSTRTLADGSKRYDCNITVGYDEETGRAIQKTKTSTAKKEADAWCTSALACQTRLAGTATLT